MRSIKVGGAHGWKGPNGAHHEHQQLLTGVGCRGRGHQEHQLAVHRVGMAHMVRIMSISGMSEGVRIMSISLRCTRLEWPTWCTSYHEHQLAVHTVGMAHMVHIMSISGMSEGVRIMSISLRCTRLEWPTWCTS